MILNKISSKNNSKLIAEKYVEWLNSGASPCDILVLTLDSGSKINITKNILKLVKENSLSEMQIHNLKGLIYNTVINNWDALEGKINNNNTAILPALNGMEISQYILKQIIKEEDVKGYNSKKSLLHQIFRRYSLIVNNNLTPEEVDEKSKIIGEAFGKDAEKIIQKLMAKTISLRAFDNIRQAQIFSYIYKNTDYFKGIKYLITEDSDEFSPLILDFIRTISPQLKDKFIILDKDGGSRRGFLCAAPDACEILQDIFNEQITDNSVVPKYILNLQDNILKDENNKIDNLQFYSVSKRLEMAEKTAEIINNLIKSGCKPNDISVITPIQDNLIKYTMQSNLKNCSPVFLSGNEKLSDNPLIKTTLSILKLSLNMPVNEQELRTIISKYIGIPIKNTKKIIDYYSKNKTMAPIEMKEEAYTEKIKNFCTILEELENSGMKLSEKANHIYINNTRPADKYTLSKFNFFLKELQSFETVFKNPKISEEEIILQLENSIISENPYSSPDIDSDELVVATPQKIIDNKLKTKYQFWLDVSSSEWIKSDIGPLYNSWVFQKSWGERKYTIDDNIRLSKDKTSRILRKLMLLTNEVIALSSIFDTQGAENIGGIEKYLIPNTSDKNFSENKKSISIIPREDQKPVLEYKSGKMAISAVPGAGKTTILLALIIKLLENKIEPENIYVLTYMESAARNFKDKIKGINEKSNKIPNISTIHGLALRILKENSNYERIGLNPDFEICDDTQRGNILKSITKNISKQDYDDFDRGISILKLSGKLINLTDTDEIKHLLKLKKGNKDELRLSRFLKFFFDYQNKLKQNNLIDYDDILILSVKLLEENKDILEYYQSVCEYIIEDEAQDSSYVQQKLINLLSSKHNNLIRCGDINQAITTTFTNADVKGFRDFIETSDCVKMNCSQRCTKEIWKLANALVKYGNSHSQNPFYEIYMNPVEGKNPVESNPIHANIYNTAQEEKSGVANLIKNIFKTNPTATVGILLRNNYQVNSWADYMNNCGLTAITRNECLAQKKIFKVIFSILKFISEPFDNKIAACAYKTLSECGIFKRNSDKFIETYKDEQKDEETAFISLDNDEIADSDLARFHWDMNYWLSFPELSIDELAMRIGLNYFSENIEKSNIYLIATLCAKLDRSEFSQTVQSLEELSKRASLSGFKFFSEDEEETTGGKIQVMTLHKSKGDEFDYVFIPEMSEGNLALDINQLKLKKSGKFEEDIRGLNETHKKMTETEMKQCLLNENYRLLYVGITRARKRLYISVPKKEIYFNRQKDTVPSIIFDELLNMKNSLNR